MLLLCLSFFLLGIIFPWCCDIQGVALRTSPAVSRGAADCLGPGLCQAQWVTSPQSPGQAAVEPEAKPPATGDVTLSEKQGQHPASPLLIQLTADCMGTSCTGHMVMIHIRSCKSVSCKTSSRENVMVTNWNELCSLWWGTVGSHDWWGGWSAVQLQKFGAKWCSGHLNVMKTSQEAQN